MPTHAHATGPAPARYAETDGNGVTHVRSVCPSNEMSRQHARLVLERSTATGKRRIVNFAAWITFKRLTTAREGEHTATGPRTCQYAATSQAQPNKPERVCCQQGREIRQEAAWLPAPSGTTAAPAPHQLQKSSPVLFIPAQCRTFGKKPVFSRRLRSKPRAHALNALTQGA